MTMADVADLESRLDQLAEQLEALLRMADLFYECGRADALGQRPRVPNPTRVRDSHLRVVKP